MSSPDQIAAPLDPTEIQRVLEARGAGRGLPKEAYVSREVFQWEVERFWAGGWVSLGRSEDLARPGDRRALRSLGEGFLIVRGESGVLRVFYNGCRHRAHELLRPDESASSDKIRCPYHGWTYDLAGRLTNAPRMECVLGFNPAEQSLAQVHAVEWRGWVMVNLSGHAPAFESWIGDLDTLVQEYEPERLHAGAAKSYEVSANWKLVHENYHECYHCPSIHPELCKVTPHDSGRNARSAGEWVGGRMDLMPHAQTMSLDGRSGGVPLRGLQGERLRQVHYYALLPNLFLSMHPDYVLTHRLEPIAPDRTRIACEWLFPPEALEKPGFSPAYAVELWDLTNGQDWRAIESVQRGVGSRGFRPGTLANKEDAVLDFVQRIARGYRAGRLGSGLPDA